MATILERGVYSRQAVVFDTELIGDDPRNIDGIVLDADFEACTVTLQETIPAEWVRENPNGTR